MRITSIFLSAMVALLTFFSFVFLQISGFESLPAKLTRSVIKSSEFLFPGSSTCSPFQNSSHIDKHLVNDISNLKLFSLIHNSEQSFYDSINEVVGTTKFKPNEFSRQPYVANGYLGARIPNLGQGFSYDQTDNSSSLNGWPLLNKRYSGAFISGFFDLEEKLPSTNFPELYERGYDSVISAIPQWTSLKLIALIEGKNYSLDPQTTDHSEISNYAQNMSFINGIVSTSFTWLESLNIKYQVMAHRKNPNLATVTLELNTASLSRDNVTIWVEDTLDFDTSQRCNLNNLGFDEEGIYISVSPNLVDYSSAVIYSTWDLKTETSTVSKDSYISKAALVEINPTSTFKVTKYVGIVSTEYDPSIQNMTEFAKDVALSAMNKGYDQILDEHEKEWASYLKGVSLSIPSDNLLNLSAKTSLFHLLTNTRPTASGLNAALSVSGLSSDSYGGMIFWDTDLWMSLGLLPFAPFNVKALTYYRLYTHQQALKNAESYNYDGAVYPWTSGRFGNCTSTGPCVNYEYHINVAIALSSWHVYLSGAGDDAYLREVTYPLVSDAANFLSDVVEYNKTYAMYTINNMTDPDEFANFVDNGAYTNAGISAIMKWALVVSKHLGEPINEKWAKIAGNMYMPKSEDGITLEYSGMNSSIVVKQADVILMDYPLEDEESDIAQGLKDMHWYSEKQSSTGPAMTFPLYSIVSAHLSKKGCSSQSFLKRSAFPYLRAPFAQFSEQSCDDYNLNGGTHPAFPFLTAHGGYLQAVVQGPTGLRYDYKLDNETSGIVRILKVDPIYLPCLKGGIQIEGIKFINQSLNFDVSDFDATITHNGAISGEEAQSVLLKIAERNEMSGEYTLEPGTELKIPLYHPEKNIEHSIAECKSIVNVTVGVPGDVSLAAIDGDNSTDWQPLGLGPAQLLIDLGDTQNISSGVLVWGERPAKQMSLSIIPESYYDNYTTLNQLLTVVEFSSNTNNTLSWLTNEERMQVNYDNQEAIRKFMNLENVTTFKENDIFVKVVKDHSISISAPYSESEFSLVKELPDNVTYFDFSIVRTRFVLLEFEGVIDTNGNTAEGATVSEIALFN